MAKDPTKDHDLPQLQCRGWTHPWEDVVTYVSRIGAVTVYDAHLRCPRCGGERFDTKVKGHRGVIARRYHMPDSYAAPGYDRWEFREWAIEAVLKDQAVPAPDDVKAEARKRIAGFNL